MPSVCWFPAWRTEDGCKWCQDNYEDIQSGFETTGFDRRGKKLKLVCSCPYEYHLIIYKPGYSVCSLFKLDSNVQDLVVGWLV